ncbi:flagellar biosynthesis protein FlhB [Steroidobacter flavus]|uniref:Flagellar biosynthetic protein FlhB n=1 Tax=Steroidobacter flavus TaxID=1842136 RepID=A0ABV8T1Y9_9GAMM
MAEQEQNRTEQATPFKLNEAKRRGQVAKSLDLNTALVSCGMFALLVSSGDDYLQRLCELSASLFAGSATLTITGDTWPTMAAHILFELLGTLWPIAVVGMVLAVLSNVVQTGPILSMEPLKPKFERLNPVNGFKRVFNKKMLFEAFKSLLKLIFFGCVLYGFFATLWFSLAATGGTIQQQLEWMQTHGSALLIRLGLAMLIIGLLDLAYTRWSFGKQMMMSRRELKEEIKRREGDPLIKAKLRELQRENMKQAQSMSRVPKADVLITNPEHLAIALCYRRDEMNAPLVLAKGADSWAAEMRAVARKHDIPIFENRKLARLLFRRSQVDAAIPPESFLEVAKVYAELNRRRTEQSRVELPA